LSRSRSIINCYTTAQQRLDVLQAFDNNIAQIPHAIAVFSDGAFFRAGWDRTHYKNLTVVLTADFRLRGARSLIQKLLTGAGMENS
jgi:hypothetical protein